MKHLIKKILKEQVTDKVITKVLSQLESGRIKPPYFKNLDLIGLTPEEIKVILEKFTNGNVNMEDRVVRNSGGNILYSENYNGYWTKTEYDERGNNIYYESPLGWVKRIYDENGVIIYNEDSDDGIILDER